MSKRNFQIENAFAVTAEISSTFIRRHHELSCIDESGIWKNDCVLVSAIYIFHVLSVHITVCAFVKNANSHHCFREYVVVFGGRQFQFKLVLDVGTRHVQFHGNVVLKKKNRTRIKLCFRLFIFHESTHDSVAKFNVLCVRYIQNIIQMLKVATRRVFDRYVWSGFVFAFFPQNARNRCTRTHFVMKRHDPIARFKTATVTTITLGYVKCFTRLGLLVCFHVFPNDTFRTYFTFRYWIRALFHDVVFVRWHVACVLTTFIPEQTIGDDVTHFPSDAFVSVQGTIFLFATIFCIAQSTKYRTTFRLHCKQTLFLTHTAEVFVFLCHSVFPSQIVENNIFGFRQNFDEIFHFSNVQTVCDKEK